MQVWAVEFSFLGHKASTETTQVQMYSTPILLATGLRLWGKPNSNVSCSDGLVGGQASIWYPDSQIKEKLSAQEGITPQTFSDTLNTPKLCWDLISLGTNFLSPALPSLTCLFLVWQRSERDSYPTSGKRQQVWDKLRTFSGLPQFILLEFVLFTHLCPFLLLEGSQNGSEEEKSSEVAHSPGSLAAQVGHGLETELPMGLANRVSGTVLHYFLP